VRAAEREARIAEQAIAEQRRSAEEEVRRYLAAARLHADAETAARAARIETLSAAAKRLSDELTDAVTALTRELQRDDEPTSLPRAPWPAQQAQPAPEATWTRATEPTPAPEPEPAPANADRAGGAGEDDSATLLAESPRPATGPAGSSAGPEHAEPAPAANGTTNGTDQAVPSAARLVAIEMAVGGSSRQEVEEHLRRHLHVADPQELLDDVFGTASHAGSRLAWGEP